MLWTLSGYAAELTGMVGSKLRWWDTKVGLRLPQPDCVALLSHLTSLGSIFLCPMRWLDLTSCFLSSSKI